MKISIKNMVCNRCIMLVNQIFQEAGIQVKNVQLGIVETNDEVNDKLLKKIDNKLKDVGFEIINNSKRRLIEQIKTAAIDFVLQKRWVEKNNFSDYLTDKLNLDYPYLSSLNDI